MPYDLTEYFRRFGTDIAAAEHQTIQKNRRRVQQWLFERGGVLCGKFDCVVQSAQQLAPAYPNIDGLARMTAIHSMLSGIIDGGLWWYSVFLGGGQMVSRSFMRPFQQLLQVLLSVRTAPCDFSQAQQAIDSEIPLFEQEAKLTRVDCGTFWKCLIASLPPYVPGGSSDPKELYDLLYALEDCYTLFSDKSGSPYLDDLWDALDWHWQSYTVFHVDRAAAEDAVKRWDFAERPDAMKELLIAVYSDELRRFSPEVLFHANESEILEEVYQKDPVLAIRMWRFLLDTAEAHLQEPEAAQYLLWEIIDFALFPPYSLCPILKELAGDPRFVRQVFGSAYVDFPHLFLLDGCAACGQPELREKLLLTVSENPFFHPEDQG